MSLSDYAAVTVSRTTQAPSQMSFNTLGILAWVDIAVVWSDYQRLYDANADGLAQMVTDGFNTFDPAYRIAARFVSQDGHPPHFRVLRRATANQQGIKLEPDHGGVVPPAGYVISVNITGPNGVTRSYTRTSEGGTKAAEATQIAAMVNADASGWGTAGSAEFTCVAAGDVVEFNAEVATKGRLWYYRDLTYLLYTDVTADPGIADDLTAICTYGSDDFYGVVLDSESAAEVKALAGAVEAMTKIFGFTTRDSDAPTIASTDILTTLDALNYDRTFGLATGGSLATYPAAAWMGLKLGDRPGFTNWAFAKTAAGVVADDWTAAEKMNICETKSGNYYITEAKIDHFYSGQVFSGEWIDIVTLTDWTVARIQEAVFGTFIAAKKVPYTAQGVEMIKGDCYSVVRQQMLDNDSGGFVKGSELFTYPAISMISIADKADRHLPDCTLYVQFTNAINTVGLALTLSY